MIVGDIDCVRRYVPTVDTAPYSKLWPHVVGANGYLESEILGTALYGRLEDSDFPEILLSMCERVVALRAYERAIPFLDLRQTEQGFAVISTDGLVPASKDRVRALVEGCRADGESAEDSLLSMLESLTGDLKDLWVGSEACTVLTDCYISTYREFRRYLMRGSDYPVDFPKNRTEFRGLWGAMRSAIQFRIEPNISRELSARLLVEIRERCASAANLRLLEPVRFALAAFALGMRERGSEFLGQAAAMLRDSPDDYPLWRDSEVGQIVLNRVKSKNDGAIFFGSM
jgi:hypothetical protein